MDVALSRRIEQFNENVLRGYRQRLIDQQTLEGDEVGELRQVLTNASALLTEASRSLETRS